MKNYDSINIHNEQDDENLPLSDYGNGSSLTGGLSPLTSSQGDYRVDLSRHHDNNNPHPQDHLAPPFNNDDTINSTNRPSTLLVGTFNLIATIVGGGVLSLPIAFQKCGIVTTTLFMLISAYMTYMSLIMICYSSRRCGGSSYGEVVRSAFGSSMESGVSYLLFIFLLFVIAAYMVLIRDIWTPLVGLLFHHYYDGDGNNSSSSDSLGAGEVVNGDRVLMGIIILLLPFLFQRSLHALRFNCYIGFASILILCIALCRGGFQKQYHHHSIVSEDDDDEGIELKHEEEEEDNIEFFKIPSTQDVLFSFPIVMLAFLCHFNILSIQNTLHQPTRQRMKHVVGMSIGLSMLLMYFFGLGGYMLFGTNTQGNVLLNIPIVKSPGVDLGEYWLFVLGRVGCGITIILAMPLMALPCRDALLEVVDVYFHHTHHRSDANRSENDSCFWKVLHRMNRNESVHDATITTEDEVDEIVINTDEGVFSQPRRTSLIPSPKRRASILIRRDPIQRDWVFRNSIIHYVSTLMIVVCCYIGATKVDGVAIIWSLIGSSLAFVIAFILPFGCFIVIENGVESDDRHDGWIKVATVMLILSVIGAVVCTWNRFASML